MLERLDRLPPDPILGLMAAFRADTDPHKVDLGVGVYRDDHGDTPILKAVRQAEQSVLARQNTKSYVAAAGNPGFNQAMERLVFGADHPALTGGRDARALDYWLRAMALRSWLALGAPIQMARMKPCASTSTIEG